MDFGWGVADGFPSHFAVTPASVPRSTVRQAQTVDGRAMRGQSGKRRNKPG